MGTTKMHGGSRAQGLRISNKLIVAAVAGIASLGATHAGAVTYSVVNFGAGANGQADTFATSINNNGEVAINTADAGAGDHPVIFTGASDVNISSYANNSDLLQQVNNSGLAAGYSSDGSGNPQAMYASTTGPATMTPLTQLTVGGQGFAFGVSPVGVFGTATIVGTSLNSGSNFQAVQWVGNSISLLSPTNSSAWDPASGSQANGVNILGRIVGQSISTVSGNLDAFVTTSDGSFLDIAPGSSAQSLAEAINSLGVVVGRWTDADGNQHAFQYSTAGGVETLSDLYTPLDLYSSDAEGINGSGQIVGQSYNSSGSESAVIYSGGTAIDLNTQLDSTGAGWQLTNAASINDNGDIVGTGFLDGNQEAFELVPTVAVPEPTSLTMLGVAGVALLGRRRRPI